MLCLIIIVRYRMPEHTYARTHAIGTSASVRIGRLKDVRTRECICAFHVKHNRVYYSMTRINTTKAHTIQCEHCQITQQAAQRPHLISASIFIVAKSL